ncbi:MAG: transglutaminase domain-containing protein [Cellulosilyticaceae bacterium]
MVKRRYMIGIIISILLSIGIVTYGQESFITDKGNVGTTYTLNFESQKAYLSRDGGMAVPVKTGTAITKPGNYFLSTENEGGITGITRFSVLDNKAEKRKNSKVVIINNQEELEEVLKASLENYQAEVNLKINYGTFDINVLNQYISDCVDKILSMYPQITFENYTLISAGGQKPSLTLKMTYPDNNVAELKKYDQKLAGQMMEILKKNIRPNMSTYEREHSIYEYLANKITYAQHYSSNRVHTMQGALVDGKGVCDGYAKAFMYLMNATGIETRKIIGRGKGVDHAWNMVKLGNQYYHVDVTFGDADANQIGVFYDYFNETDAYMNLTHTWDKKKYPKATSNQATLMNLPITLERMYKVNTMNDWYATCIKIKSNNIGSGSVILYDNKKNQWDIDRMINQLVNILGGTIYYNTVDKYDGIIINFKIDN